MNLPFRTSTWAVAVFCVAIGTPCSAATISFVPSAQTVGIGAVVTVDVRIDGLETDFDPDEIVSAYDLDVSYNPTIVEAVGATFFNYLGGPADSIQGATLLAGVVDFFEVSLLSDGELDTLQPNSFVLASLSFRALAAGTTTLTFVPDPVFGIDVKGLDAKVLNVQAGSGSITVEGAQIPEPGTLLLLASGLARVATSRRRRSLPFT